ncbi:uncharacterized protein LOC132516494 [Lagenorhynchus albirostris]|uniref:uncharacterized protein LOC132516494 n=1 Tax=Lagenorhynchus albirostris TaxID=27610 RepID=UPI0028F15FD2|nr:uncharacterized protein LOC132516494 [Lagenorhynchus albirostris]
MRGSCCLNAGALPSCRSSRPAQTRPPGAPVPCVPGRCSLPRERRDWSARAEPPSLTRSAAARLTAEAPGRGNQAISPLPGVAALGAAQPENFPPEERQPPPRSSQRPRTAPHHRGAVSCAGGCASVPWAGRLHLTPWDSRTSDKVLRTIWLPQTLVQALLGSSAVTNLHPAPRRSPINLCEMSTCVQRGLIENSFQANFKIFHPALLRAGRQL